MAKKVLMIEDDPIILKQTLSILKLEGFDVVGAENGVVGLQTAQEALPDLIISDISMPGMDGLQLLREIRNDPRTAAIPFIFLTAQSEMTNLRQGMELGADDYLTKPFSVPELINAVNTRFDRHAAIVREQEQRITELRSNLVHMLPHELRTPLMSVLGYTDFLLDGFEDLDANRIREILRSIRRGGERLHHLIENYLLYAQMEILKSDPQQVQELRQHTIDNAKLIIDQQAQRRASKDKRNADLTLELSAVGSLQILEDSLTKIVDEMLSNAFKFSKLGSPVKLSGTVEGDCYVIRATDCGRGMTPQQIADIGLYMQFQRKLYEQQGAGLGLGIVHGLVELYNGSIEIESAVNEGTTLTVRIPLASSTGGEVSLV